MAALDIYTATCAARRGGAYAHRRDGSPAERPTSRLAGGRSWLEIDPFSGRVEDTGKGEHVDDLKQVLYVKG